MSLTKRLVILAGLIGILFYTASMDQLVAWIADFDLSWYGLGTPLAWGIILGGLFALVGVTFVDRWLPTLTLISAMLVTLGLTGTAAVAAKHQLAVLVLPTLTIATLGIGIYLFAYAFARFAGAERARKADKAKQKKS
ncbi:hypothetical protein SAMN06297229_1444 [Pseudidiomarina planktonica]|uniref:Uncharacterized protein n=1 Tax=Pseudidiomarina planktonica TaxID=1323738 RepID=A0A1Y6EYI9_9GAMM|nr:hypothetical protein [Pseudidiomarina planktonica]RUO65187.1 hypothetical protein CWI77_01550 [Pseudidiomarina planktonica]SMQ66120.1 hypothetical protein SAMN06297229_1444 [Pseudidiomarina planktonica]